MAPSALPHRQRRLLVAIAIGAQHLGQLLVDPRRQRAQARRDIDGRGLLADRDHALCHVLGQVAHALQIVGDAHGRDDLAQVDGHRLPLGDRRDGFFLDLMLQVVDLAIRRDHLLRQLDIALQQRLGRIGERMAGAAAHLADHFGEGLQVGIEGCNGVLAHD